MIKNVNIHLGYLIGTIASFGIAWSTAQGTALKYISFADPLNEMAFCFMAFCLGIACAASTFSKSK